MKDTRTPGVKSITVIGGKEFRWGERTFVMGIVNTSPDSFSGDGQMDIDAAVSQGRRFEEEGADILDVGGESTRPGSEPVGADEEIRRVVPVIEGLRRHVKIPVSIDSYKSEVALQAVESGACMINDQWGLKKDLRLGQLAAEKHLPIVLMSNQRDRGGYDVNSRRDTGYYEDVIAEVTSSLQWSRQKALEAGIPSGNIILDPGIGFGKTWQQDIEVLRRLAELSTLGQPLLIGTSRKSLIKMVLKLPAADRLEGTAATVAVGIANGADIVRVHDVRAMVRVCRMADAIVRGYFSPESGE